MTEAPSAVEVARRLADVFERERVPYAIGGALGLGYYSAPRATIDVDVNIFLSPTLELERTLASLSAAGFVPNADAAAIRAQAVSEGQFRGAIDAIRVDVFVPAIPFYAQLEKRRRRIPLLGEPAWILGPEDLVVLKMMFFRRKDLADVEGVLRALGPDLDLAFVRSTLIDLVGADDARVEAFDQIAAEVRGPA